MKTVIIKIGKGGNVMHGFMIFEAIKGLDVTCVDSNAADETITLGFKRGVDIRPLTKVLNECKISFEQGYFVEKYGK